VSTLAFVSGLSEARSAEKNEPKMGRNANSDGGLLARRVHFHPLLLLASNPGRSRGSRGRRGGSSGLLKTDVYWCREGYRNCQFNNLRGGEIRGASEKG